MPLNMLLCHGPRGDWTGGDKEGYVADKAQKQGPARGESHVTVFGCQRHSQERGELGVLALITPSRSLTSGGSTSVPNQTENLPALTSVWFFFPYRKYTHQQKQVSTSHFYLFPSTHSYYDVLFFTSHSFALTAYIQVYKYLFNKYRAPW